jgi:Fe-Mn family superoxide dismutase
LKKKIMQVALEIKGNGWIWLIINKNKELKIISTHNSEGIWKKNSRPVLTIDMWEHSYYLDYGTRKEEYLEKMFDYLLDWKKISEIFLDCHEDFSKNKKV